MSATAIAPGELDERVAGESAGGASDAGLVAAVRRGDDRAFETLYQRYHRRIAAYVYGMVNDYGRAEDITQEVFISALRRMRETERPIAFKPWVYEIAKNACIDQFRRSKRAEDGLGAADYGRLVTTGPSPDAAVDAKQQLAHLCGAFGGLSDTHHEILVLRELEGLSYRQIGEKMGLSRPSVESTLFRARRRLTEEYDELVSGQRCVRIQAIISTAATGMLGTRDSRRVARHVAHCQPCRRQAVASGLDTATLAPRPVRERVAAKVAALLPLPVIRRRGEEVASVPAGSSLAGQVAMYAEPMMAGWTKAAAAAATLVLAGGVAGVGSRLSSEPIPASHEGRASGAVAPSSAPAVRSEPRDSVKRAARGERARVRGVARRQPASTAPTTGADSQPADTPAQGGPAPAAAPADPTRVVPREALPTDPSETDPGTSPVKPVDRPLNAVEDTARSIDGNAGDAVATIRAVIGGGDGGGLGQ
jgi:RNA polymerase sigma factor (sigma-70 family)